MLVFCEKTKKQHGETNPRESSRFATPAIRTLKISAFYPKNSQKSQILLLVGSRHTSDDSPTVTQIYQLNLFRRRLFSVYNTNKKDDETNGGWWRFSATPAIRTLKISVFYPKNSQKSQILLVVGSRYTSDDSPTVTQTFLVHTSCLRFFCGDKATK